MEKNLELSTIILDDKNSVSVDDGKKAIAYFCQRMPARVDKSLLDELKKIHASLDDRNVRLCLHNSPEASVHEMLILERKGKYYRPHKHKDKGETFHIVEGRLGVFTFSEEGEVLDSCVLEQGGVFMYKVKAQMNHAVFPLTDIVIYHESKPGPFLGVNDSVYPSWAPDGSDSEEVKKFEEKLHKILSV